MENKLLKIEELKSEGRKLWDKVDIEKSKFFERVNDILNRVNNTGLRLNFSKHYSEKGLTFDNEYDFETETRKWTSRQFSVGFLNTEDKTDFGSDFDIEIKESGLAINKGTCGTYTKNDIYQVGRDKLLGRIWDFEDQFIAALKEVNKDDYLAAKEIESEIRHLKYEITIEKNKLAEESAKRELENGKYFYFTIRHSVYDGYNLKGYNCELDKHLACKIEKITPKTVKVEEFYKNWRGDGEFSRSKQLKKEDLINRIKNGVIKVYDRRLTEDEINAFSEFIPNEN